MSETKILHCGNCKHFKATPAFEGLGMCHITLPRWIFVDDGQLRGVHRDDACDLHKPRDEAKP